MLNVNRITTVLARMPDENLQKYAEMHKADPYIMALAMSESNRRKEVRSADQGSQEEQPKVVDQMIAGMAPRPAQPMPEDMGIGAIPAPNMTMAANGGIVGYDEGGMIAFADGGDVERYQSGGVIAKYQQELQEMGMGTRMQYSPDVQAFVRAQEQASRESYADRERARMLQGPYGGTATPASAATVSTAPRITPTFSADNLSGMDRRLMSGSQQPSIQSISPPAKPVIVAPRPDTRLPAGPPRENALVVRPETGPTDIDALQQKYFGSLDQDTGTLRNARAGLVAGIKDLTEKNLAATKAGIEARGDVFKGREERLAKQEKGLEGMGDRNMGLALLQAGAAMMSTPGGLGVALGKGVQVGSERYAAGLDKIEAAKSKFAEARDRLDDLRINRDDMNAKDIRAAEKDARESELKGKEMLYNGLVSDLGIKQKNVSSIFTAAASALEKDKEIASRERTTAISERGANARSAAQIAATLNTPDRLVFDKLLKDSNNDPVKALEAFKLAKGDKFNLRTSYADYIKAFAGKDGLTPPMSIEAYAGKMGALLPR